jgi:CBS domain-containing protein
MEILSDTPEGIHRLPVVDSEANLVDIITQSMLIDFIWQNLEKLGSIVDLSVSEIKGNYRVSTISENAKAIHAFRQMSLSGLSALAVVDGAGKLVDNISLRDLKGIHPDAKIFWRLWNTVKEYKAKVLADFPPPVPITAPLYVTDEHTLSNVLEKMALNHVHRIYVVDSEESMRPVKVVSQTDLLREILRRNRG